MMKIILFLFFLSFPLQGCYSQNHEAPSPQEEASRQEEAPDENAWDFGQVKQGQILKHDFILKNDSDKPLKINAINTSCGCTASKAKKSKLSSCEETSIEVKFNSKGYSGDIRQYVYVYTDSLQRPIIKFTIKADVK